MVSAVFHYLFPAFAVLLFVRVDAWASPGFVSPPPLSSSRCGDALGGFGRNSTGPRRIVLAWGGAARTRRNGLALLLAVGGVYLLTDVRLVAEPLGLAFAAANALLFALYIVLGHRVAQSEAVSGIDRLGLSMLIAAAVALPVGIWDAAPAFTDPVALAAGVGIGVSSSVIPYVCDQLAMARLKRATYALLISLLPATATLVGIVVLTQIPILPEVLGSHW